MDLEREANTLSGLIPKVREYIHKFFALGKLKSAMLKKFRVTSALHDGLTMNFAAIGGEVCEFSCSQAVSFVTKDGTMNMFDSFLKGDCSFAPETVQNDKQLLAVYQLEVDTEAARVAEFDRAKAADHAEGLAAHELHKSQMRMKKSSTAVTPSKARDVISSPQFVKNTARRDILPKSMIKTAAVLAVEAARAIKAAQKDADAGEYEHGFEMLSDDVDDQVEEVRKADKADKDFLSNEIIVENVLYVPIVERMAGESPNKANDKFYREQQSSCRRLLTSSGKLVNDEEDDEEDDEEGDEEGDEKEKMKEADEDDFLSSHSPSGSSSSSSHRKPNGSTGAPVVINGKNKKVSKRAAGSMGCSVSERKRRSRGMDADLFKTLVHLTGSGSSSSDADSLSAVFDKAEELRNITAKFRDFLGAHIQAEAFSDLNFEVKVFEYLKEMHNALDVLKDEVIVLNWPAIISNIGNQIIGAFKISNDNILCNMNLLVQERRDKDGNMTPETQADDRAEELDNKKSMKAFERVYVTKLHHIQFSLGWKLVDYWMKNHQIIHEMDADRPLAKRPKRQNFLDHVRKASMNGISCQSLYDESKVGELEKAEKELPPDVASILFFVHPLPPTDPYMNALFEITRHQVSGQIVDWDVDANMRALFHKKPLVPRQPKVDKSPTSVAVLASPAGATSSQAPSAAPTPPQPVKEALLLTPVTSVDFEVTKALTSLAPSISVGPPSGGLVSPSAVDLGEEVEDGREDSLRRLIKQLLEFLLAGLTEFDEYLCIEIKNSAYAMFGNTNEGLVLLIDLLKFALEISSGLSPDFTQRECFKLLRATIYVPYAAGDSQNTIGNGYCYYVSTFQAKERERSEYTMSVEDMSEFAAPLFQDPSDPDVVLLVEKFRDHLSSLYDCLRKEDPTAVEAGHMAKVQRVMNVYAENPDVGIEQDLYGHLEWVTELDFNVSVFSSVHLKSDLVGRWAKLAASSHIPRANGDKGTFCTFEELENFFRVPPNFIAWMLPHFFTIFSPSQTVMQSSFVTLVGRLVDRIKDRAVSIDLESVLTVCEDLLGMKPIDVSATNVVSAAIESIFSGMRVDARVPTAVLVDFFKPAASTAIKAKTSRKDLEAYKQRVFEQVVFFCIYYMYTFNWLAF